MKLLPTVADVADDAEHCSYCPKLCRFACPVAEATGMESVTPWGIDRAITEIARTGRIDEETAAPVWACTGCRGCGSACLPGLDLPTHVRAARAAVVDAGLAPAAVDAAGGRDEGPAGALRHGATAGAPVVVYPGCRSSDSDALAAVLAAAGVAYDVVDAATCCGARDADIGRPAAATQRRDDLLGRIAAAATVVVADPHCARWLLVDAEDDRVVAVPAFLERLLDGLPFREDVAAVTWHDPCWLGRGMASYDAARAVVGAAAGAPPLEPEHTRDRTWCTGGGMGYPEADPVGAGQVLARRVDDLRATGAAVTVTACPTAAARLRAGGLDAFDLTGFVAGRLEHR